MGTESFKKIKDKLKKMLNLKSDLLQMESSDFEKLLEEFRDLIIDMNYLIIELRPSNNEDYKLQLYQSVFCNKITYGEFFKISDTYKIIDRIITNYKREKLNMIYEISKIYSNFMNDIDDSQSINEININELTNIEIEDYSPHILLNDYVIERKQYYKGKIEKFKDEFILLVLSIKTYFDKNNKQIKELL